MKIILTGATGMVGEGVLFECLKNPDVEEILLINRQKYKGGKNPKLKEFIVLNFFDLSQVKSALGGYDACFFCAGVSSIGMSEKDYMRVTYDMTLSFAKTLLELNTQMVFCYVSGAYTDSSEKGKIMWARVKGKTENALQRLPFRKVYNFRPGFMEFSEGQKNVKGRYKFLYRILLPIFKIFAKKMICRLSEVGSAMINSVKIGYPKSVLEIEDIKTLAKEKDYKKL
ncbi:MAG: NAD-dependent epimerase/dehydratase family protein [Flavobacteriaceae bacterium]|jgi:uncharacterized protein YbjT (DUF2867 family)|nr:NAD-dependent epimerase/dehydratase family protein [Flavobacteriaceae bacterium]